MNKKGQIAIGGILLAAIGIIVGLVLLTDSIADNTAAMTELRTQPNMTVSSVYSSTVTLVGKSTSNFVAGNATGVTIPANNYTLNNNVILADGTLGATVTWKEGDLLAKGAGPGANVTYTYQPLGYVNDSAGRAMTNLIVLFCAIAIFVVALVPTLRNGVLNMVGK